jgi:CDP-diacylglycerol--glycerol-3-phosphate 3-phosphatidyltransferase
MSGHFFSFNIPNALTMLRVLLIPAFIWAYVHVHDPRAALAIFLIAGFTDYLDGYLARKWNQITAFGKLMDPLADKLMTLSALICLASAGHLAWWVFYIVLIKEALMVAGSLVMLKHRVVVMANLTGKLAAIAFTLAIYALFPWHSNIWLKSAGEVVMYLAVALSLYAMAVYGRNAYLSHKNTEITEQN